mgnify:CR=1 FL=1
MQVYGLGFGQLATFAPLVTLASVGLLLPIADNARGSSVPGTALGISR